MYICFRCGHEWKGRNQEKPAICPKCKSKKWDENKDGEIDIDLFSKISKDMHDSGFSSVLEKAIPTTMIYDAIARMEEGIYQKDKYTLDDIKHDIEIIKTCKSLMIKHGLSSGHYYVLADIEEIIIRRKHALIEAKNYKPIKTEKELELNLIKTWDKTILSERYLFVKNQVLTNDGDLIDIFAKTTGDNRPVIIELKKGNKNGYKQLNTYAKEYANPILINISEKHVVKEKSGVIYFTFDELFNPEIKETLKPLFETKKLEDK